MILLVQSKFVTYSKNSLKNLQQYHKNHCVYLARIGHHSKIASGKKARCSIELFIFTLHNLHKWLIHHHHHQLDIYNAPITK